MKKNKDDILNIHKYFAKNKVYVSKVGRTADR